MPTLNKFMQWLKDGNIRTDIQQGSGWLIVLGALEYNSLPDYKTETVNHFGKDYKEIDFDSMQAPNDWKVGAYEPTTCIHGDIEYLYTIDLKTKEIEVQKVGRIGSDYATSKQTFTTISTKELQRELV